MALFFVLPGQFVYFVAFGGNEKTLVVSPLCANGRRMAGEGRRGGRMQEASKGVGREDNKGKTTIEKTKDKALIERKRNKVLEIRMQLKHSVKLT
jgi:hypothetical protein